MKKPIRINAARWFQKTYGNTYFSCDVFFDDGTIETVTKFQYGYGDHYLTVAIEWLIHKAILQHLKMPVKLQGGNCCKQIRLITKCEM